MIGHVSLCTGLVCAFVCQPVVGAIFEANPEIDTFLSSPLLGSNVGDGVTTCCDNPVPTGELISSHSTLEVDTDQGGNGPVEPIMLFDLANDFTEFGPESLQQLFINDPQATATLRLAVVNGFGPLDVRRITVDWLSNPTTGGDLIQRANFPAAPSDSMLSAFVEGLNVENESFTTPVPAIPVSDAMGFVDFDVTADLRAWTSGEVPNYGWAFIPSDSNGGTIIASENDDLPSNLLAAIDATAADLPALRPTLVLDIFVPPPIELEINARTGEVVLRGTNTGGIQFNSYEVQSNQGALRPTQAETLAAQGIDAVDGPVDDDVLAGNGPGETWQVIHASENSLIEGFLLGSTPLSAGDQLSLGQLYDVGVTSDAVTLEFSLTSGQTFTAEADFLLPPAPSGDFDGSSSAAGSDFLLWQRQRGATESGLASDDNQDQAVDAADLGAWRAAYGQTDLAVRAVPEPSGLGIAGLAALLCVCGSASRIGRV